MIHLFFMDLPKESLQLEAFMHVGAVLCTWQLPCVLHVAILIINMKLECLAEMSYMADDVTFGTFQLVPNL